jgi:hypothetical protein
MAKTFVGLRLNDDLLKLIDDLAEKEGSSRTEVMEDALRRGLDDEVRFVEMLERPLQGLIVKGLVKAGIVDAVCKALGDGADMKRTTLARGGLKRSRGRGKQVVVEVKGI